MPEISNARIREILARKERGEKLTIAERALAGFPEKEPESELSEALPENNVVDENVTVLDNQFEGFDAKYEIETKATLIAMSKEITPESDPKATSNIASAISNNIYRNYRAVQNARLSSGEDVKSDTYGDKETFDALSDMAQKTKDVSARARIAHSMGNIIIIGDKSTRDLYDNDQTKSM